MALMGGSRDVNEASKGRSWRGGCDSVPVFPSAPFTVSVLRISPRFKKHMQNRVNACKEAVVGGSGVSLPQAESPSGQERNF